MFCTHHDHLQYYSSDSRVHRLMLREIENVPLYYFASCPPLSEAGSSTMSKSSWLYPRRLRFQSLAQYCNSFGPALNTALQIQWSNEISWGLHCMCVLSSNIKQSLKRAVNNNVIPWRQLFHRKIYALAAVFSLPSSPLHRVLYQASNRYLTLLGPSIHFNFQAPCVNLIW